jgi:hypothetical protein
MSKPSDPVFFQDLVAPDEGPAPVNESGEVRGGLVAIGVPKTTAQLEAAYGGKVVIPEVEFEDADGDDA